MSLSRGALARSIFLPVVLLSSVLTTSAFAAVDSSTPKTSKLRPSSLSQNGIPVVFEENVGQLPAGTLFAGRAQAYSIQVKPSSLSFAMTGKYSSRRIDIDFNGAQPAQPVGMDQAAFRTNYYIGNDPQNWHTGVRNFDRIALRGLYTGIDAEFYSHNSVIEHDFLLAPHADASLLSMHLSGASGVRLAENGDLILDADDGYLRLHKPQAYQVLADGSHHNVAANFSLSRKAQGTADLTFLLGSYDPSRQLVIDPVITYATYASGSAGSVSSAIVSDASGNVYLTGYTGSSIASWAATTTSGSSSPAGGNSDAFVAELSSTANGSSIAWLSYIGGATGATTGATAALATPQTGKVLYIGGYTWATDLPTPGGTTFQTNPTHNHSQFGFVSRFDTASGALVATTYVEGTHAQLTAGLTLVNSIAASPDGTSLAIGGVTTGAAFPVTTNALVSTGLIAAIADTATTKAIVLQLDSSLKTQKYGTYLGGDMDLGTTLTGIAIDAVGNFYVSGSTFGDFPKAGTYGPALLTAIYPPPTGGGDQNGFAAQLVPGGSTTTLGFSYWTGGGKNDVATGVTLDGAGTLYVSGNTSSTDLVANGVASTTYTASGNVITPLNTLYPTGATQSGFLAEIDATGSLLTSTFIGASTTGSSTSLNSVAVDAQGKLYLAGGTNGQKASFPSQTSALAVVSPLLPGSPVPQDLTQDSAPPTLIQRGYVMQLAPAIATVSGLAYVGPSNGTAAAVSVAVDNTANAYVAVIDTPAAGGSDFVTASAAQPGPQVTDGTTTSGYVAKLVFAAASTGSIVAGGNTQNPGTAVFTLPLTDNETLVWNINGAGTTGGGSPVVFNLPFSTYLTPYTLSMLTYNGDAVTGTQCTLGTSTLASAAPGITCVIPNLASGSVGTFTLNDTLTNAVFNAATAAQTSVTISAAAFDAQGDSLDLTQTLPIALGPTFTITDTVNGAQTATVNAAVSAPDTSTPNSAVTYSYIITNTSSVDAQDVKLVTNLSTSSSTFSMTSWTSSTGCNPETASSGCDLPAGKTLTYTATGYYIGSQFTNQSATTYTSNTSAPAVNASHAAPVTGTALSVNIYGNATLAVALTTSAFTSPTGFRLGDTNVAITASLSNTGVNTAGSATVTLTLPKGFVASSSSFTAGTGSAACAQAPFTSCTFTNITVGKNSAVFTVIGSFSDTGTAADAVAPPLTSATPSAATVASSATSGSVSASVPVGGITVPAVGTYVNLPATGTTSGFTVSRSNGLTFSLGATIPAATPPLPSNTVNEVNSGNIADTVVYTATLSNLGPSVARGVFFTFPLPVSATGTTATISNLTASYSSPVNPANQLICSSATSLVTCYEADLQTVATTPVVTPSNLTYTVSFNATFPETTVPLTTTSGMTTVSQSGSTYMAAASGLNSPSFSNGNPTVITVQRSTKIVQVESLSPSIHPPAGYLDTSDLNLDEHTVGNVAGNNDSITFTSVAYNAGVNDAAGVSISIPVPPYLLVLSALPATCTINGVSAASAAFAPPYNTGASGITLVCSSASATTPAGTASQQLTASGTSCALNSAACIYVSFLAKFADAPPTATLVGSATVVTNPTIVGSNIRATVPAFSGIVSGNNVDTGSSTGSAPFGVQRAAHLLETYTIVPQVHAPATFSDITDINLDEHVANNAAGVNDVVLFTSSTSNTGVNYALSTSVVLPLPAYLELFSLPTGCTITGASSTIPTAVAPYFTGANGGSLNCVPPASTAITPNPVAGVLQYAGTCAAAITAQCFYATFTAKFVDASTAATIVGNNPTALVTPSAAAVTGMFSDSNTNNTPNIPTAFNVQRAAHLRLATTNPIATTYTDNSALTLDGATPMIGQAAYRANALTQAVIGGTVYNCIRYTVTVVNEGPNYTNTPTLNYAITQAPFTTALQTVGAATTQGPVNCAIGGAFGALVPASATQTLAIGPVPYGNGTQTLVLDGYFGVSALVGVNSAISAFQTAAFTQQDYKDSDINGTNAKDYLAAKSVEVVNTPVTNTTVGGFTLTPTGTTPAVKLIFTNVTAPGITSSVVSTSSLTAGPLPAGKSPYPPDASAVKPLYQVGQNPRVYMVPTTALVPTVGSNPTSVCITALAGSLPDLFAKPERTLLWALQNVPGGTTYNPMPTPLTISTSAAAPAPGDITVSVTPSGLTPYAAVPNTITFPQSPQAQPSQLCGQVNGFTTSTVKPATFAVLEPVNFAPYVVAATTSVSAQQGKGSTAAQTDIFLQVSNSQTHDFNDSDPCYIAGTRSTCNDNPYLYAFVFGGGNTGTLPTPLLVSSLLTEQNCNSGSACPNGRNLLQANLSAGSEAYVAVADQVTGADTFDDKVVASGAYTANPFTTQGNFLTSNAAGGYTVCDPGVASGYYVITTKACSVMVPAATTVVPSELYLAAGSATSYTIGNVGAAQVTGSSGGTGLITLPYPASPSTPFAQVPVNPTASSTSTTLAPAIAYVTPGQTAGFIWNWLNGSVEQSPNSIPQASKYNYTLACTAVTSLSNVTPVSLPAGTTCGISTSDPNALSPQTFASNAANYAPTIYVTTTGNLFAKLTSPVSKQIGGLFSLAMLLPIIALRRRLRRGMVLTVMLLSLATVPMLTGCGSSGNMQPTSTNVTPTGTYYFQVTATATSTTTSPAAVYSAVFEVVVQPAN
ncbi:beta strand repeat-containing protein [Granulicella paludicola]|uniref:beta strand repeat-containing protein n=1 Tax=Granulicella paludicola TaxID=474951 RepID=UPI0021E0D25A|nr:hypothetical protein [Granulicella paludicola]